MFSTPDTQVLTRCLSGGEPLEITDQLLEGVIQQSKQEQLAHGARWIVSHPGGAPTAIDAMSSLAAASGSSLIRSLARDVPTGAGKPVADLEDFSRLYAGFRDTLTQGAPRISVRVLTRATNPTSTSTSWLRMTSRLDWGPTAVRDFRTPLGRVLGAIRRRIVEGSTPLLDWDGITREVRARRGETDAESNP